jgi:hypothetical protein
MDTSESKAPDQPLQCSTPSRGFVPLPREVIESDYWTSEKFSRGHAIADLFAMANYLHGHFRIRGVRVDLAPGQLAQSDGHLANRWKWSVGKVRKFLCELEDDGIIVQQKSNVTTVITIVNHQPFRRGSRADYTSNERADDRTNEITSNSSNGNTDHSASDITNDRQLKKETIQHRNNLLPQSKWNKREEEDLALLIGSRGVNQNYSGITRARARGVSPGSIRELVAEFDANPGAWDAGALYDRITGESAGWPKPKDSYVREIERENKNAQYQAQQGANTANRLSAKEKNEEQSRLVDKWSSRIGSLSKSEQDQLLMDGLGYLPPGLALIKHAMRPRVLAQAAEILWGEDQMDDPANDTPCVLQMEASIAC